METLVISCICKHTDQDARYGVGKRLHNSTRIGWRCTVCMRASVGGAKAKAASPQSKRESR